MNNVIMRVQSFLKIYFISPPPFLHIPVYTVSRNTLLLFTAPS